MPSVIPHPLFEGSSVPGEQVTASSLSWGGAADSLAPERERLYSPPST